MPVTYRCWKCEAVFEPVQRWHAVPCPVCGSDRSGPDSPVPLVPDDTAEWEVPPELHWEDPDVVEE